MAFVEVRHYLKRSLYHIHADLQDFELFAGLCIRSACTIY